MIPYVKVKYRVIVSGHRAKEDNLELGIFTSKYDSTCHKKSELSFLCIGPKTISFIINSYYTIIKKIVVKKDKRIQCF